MWKKTIWFASWSPDLFEIKSLTMVEHDHQQTHCGLVCLSEGWKLTFISFKKTFLYKMEHQFVTTTLEHWQHFIFHASWLFWKAWNKTSELYCLYFFYFNGNFILEKKKQGAFCFFYTLELRKGDEIYLNMQRNSYKKLTKIVHLRALSWELGNQIFVSVKTLQRLIEKSCRLN